MRAQETDLAGFADDDRKGHEPRASDITAESQGHVRRVEEVFDMEGVERQTASSPAIDGILKEGDGITGEVDVDDEQILDAALIAAAQAVEPFEIARYGTLIAWAKELGRTDCASVLHENLEVEKRLTKS